MVSARKLPLPPLRRSLPLYCTHPPGSVPTDTPPHRVSDAARETGLAVWLTSREVRSSCAIPFELWFDRL
jgi:hypothetical protein